MLKVNDKIKYVKENSMIGIPVGTVMTITDIKDNTISVYADYSVNGTIRRISGIMSYDEYEKYFEKVIETESKMSTPWTEDSLINFCSTNGCTPNECVLRDLCAIIPFDDIKVFYRQINNKVIVKVKVTESEFFSNGKTYRDYARCYPTDVFSLSKGKEIALYRIIPKIIDDYYTRYYNDRIVNA